MFDSVTLKFNGQSYHIEPDRVMRAIAIVEDIVTLDELVKYHERGTAPMAKLAMAYASLIRYCGGACTDAEVYESMFREGNQSAVSNSIGTLLAMMIPKTIDENAKAPAEGNAQQSGKRSSKRHTKQLSD